VSEGFRDFPRGDSERMLGGLCWRNYSSRYSSRKTRLFDLESGFAYGTLLSYTHTAGGPRAESYNACLGVGTSADF